MPPKTKARVNKALEHQHAAEEHITAPKPSVKRSGLALGIGLAIILAAVAGALNSRPNDKAAQQAASETETAEWQTYTDPKYGFSFKHPGDWVVAAKEAGGDYMVIIKPSQNPGHEKMTVFASSQGFLGFDGLPQSPGRIAGAEAVLIGDTLAGVNLKEKGIYLTFDAGYDSRAYPVYKKLLDTVQFN